LDAHRLTAIRHPEAGQKPPGPFGASQADGVIYLTPQFLHDQANSPHVFHTDDHNVTAIVEAIGKLSVAAVQ
jgi:hypothetical protein